MKFDIATTLSLFFIQRGVSALAQEKIPLNDEKEVIVSCEKTRNQG